MSALSIGGGGLVRAGVRREPGDNSNRPQIKAACSKSQVTMAASLMEQHLHILWDCVGF